MRALQLVGEVEHRAQLVRAPVLDPEEIAALQLTADSDHTNASAVACRPVRLLPAPVQTAQTAATGVLNRTMA